MCRRSIDCIIPLWNSDTLDEDSYSFQLVRCTAADRVGEQSSHRTEEGGAADVVDVGVGPAERGEDPSGRARGVADAAKIRNDSTDIDAPDRLTAQRAARASQDRDIVATVDEYRIISVFVGNEFLLVVSVNKIFPYYNKETVIREDGASLCISDQPCSVIGPENV